MVDIAQAISNGNSNGTFSIVKLGKPRNEIANLSIEKKKSRREICKIWKANSIKEDHDTSFELYTRCSAFQMRMNTADRKRIFIFRLEFIVEVFTKKERKYHLSNRALLRFHTVLSVYFPLEMEIVYILSVWRLKILCSNVITRSQGFGLWFFKDPSIIVGESSGKGSLN